MVAETGNRAGQAKAAKTVDSRRVSKIQSHAFMQYDVSDIFALLRREIWLMLIVFAVIFGAGLFVAMGMTQTYTAGASLLMKVGDDYAYVPRTGDPSRGTIATIDEVVQSEVEILNSNGLKRRVIDKLGYGAIIPDLPTGWVPRNEADKLEADKKAMKILYGGFETGTTPQINVVRLSFKHENPNTAALILNTMIDEYVSYRQQVFSDVTAPVLEEQKNAFDRRLHSADVAFENFLTQNGVGDFQAAKATYAKLHETVLGQLYDAESRIAEGNARLSALNARVQRLAPEISLSRDLDLSIPSKLLALKAQREDLLARYQPSAPPVKDIEAQIAQYEQMMASGRGVGEREHRLGINPIYQDLLTEKLRLEAELASLNGRRSQLKAQVDHVNTKMQSLMGLEGEYNSLSAEREALQTNIRAFTNRIQDTEAAAEIAKVSEETVRVVDRAEPPLTGKSLKKLVLIGSFLFAAFTALCAGLAMAYSRKGFVSARSASRMIDLPVLATAGAKKA